MDLIEKIKAGLLDESELLEYVTDNDIEIALAVAQADNATEPILDIAAHDLDRRMRLAALTNQNAGVKTVEFLCNDHDAEISAMAKKVLEEAF